MDDFKHNLGKANLQAKLCDCNLHAKFQVSFHQVVTTLVAIFEDAILQMNINLEHCHRHCYDGASGTKKGVAKVIATKESCAIYTYCYGHALNLGDDDTVKQCNLMKSALNAMAEISKLIKKSPKRDALF